MTDSDGWTWSDSWFLAATRLADTGSGCHRSALVQVADYLEHAVISDEEIEHAVRLMVPAGLLTVDADRFRLTAAGRQRADTAAKGPGTRG